MMDKHSRILDVLEELASAILEPEKNDFRSALSDAAHVLRSGINQEELAALAILARESCRGHQVMDLGHLVDLSIRDCSIPFRWDLVLPSLKKHKHVAIFTPDGTRLRSADRIKSMMRGDQKFELRIALLIQDDKEPGELRGSGYGSNTEYLTECFEYLEALRIARDAFQRSPRNRQNIFRRSRRRLIGP